MGFALASVWVLIPITAIIVGGVKEYLKFRAEQQSLGTATSELEATVARLENERREMAKRIENLEAIVTSRTWSVLRDGSLPAPERQAVAAATAIEFEAPRAEPEPQLQAAELARRLRA